MTNALLDLLLKNGAVSFYDKKGEELTVETNYCPEGTAPYVIIHDYSETSSVMVFEGDADGLLAFLQEVCL